MIFKQWISASRELSYLLADPVTRLAVVIDLTEECVPRLQKVVGKLDLELRSILMTHAESELIRVAQSLRSETGARLAVPAALDLDADYHLHGDEQLHFGEETLRVISAGKHTGACETVCYRWGDCLFTGTWLSDEKHTREQALPPVLREMPAETLVYPGVLVDQCAVSNIGEQLLRRGQYVVNDALSEQGHGHG